jgi:hypothetical protein
MLGGKTTPPPPQGGWGCCRPVEPAFGVERRGREAELDNLEPVAWSVSSEREREGGGEEDLPRLKG